MISDDIAPGSARANTPRTVLADESRLETYRTHGEPAWGYLDIVAVPGSGVTWSVNVGGSQFQYRIDFAGGNTEGIASSLAKAINGYYSSDYPTLQDDIPDNQVVRPVWAVARKSRVVVISTRPGTVGNSLVLTSTNSLLGAPSGATLSGGVDVTPQLPSGAATALAQAGQTTLLQAAENRDEAVARFQLNSFYLKTVSMVPAVAGTAETFGSVGEVVSVVFVARQSASLDNVSEVRIGPSGGEVLPLQPGEVWELGPLRGGSFNLSSVSVLSNTTGDGVQVLYL